MVQGKQRSANMYMAGIRTTGRQFWGGATDRGAQLVKPSPNW